MQAGYIGYVPQRSISVAGKDTIKNGRPRE